MNIDTPTREERLKFWYIEVDNVNNKQITLNYGHDVY